MHRTTASRDDRDRGTDCGHHGRGIGYRPRNGTVVPRARVFDRAQVLQASSLQWLAAEPLAIVIAGDVTDASVNLEAADRAEETFGALEVAVLNAGVRGTADLETDSMDVFDRSIAVNLRVVVLGLRACVPAMRRSAAVPWS